MKNTLETSDETFASPEEVLAMLRAEASLYGRLAAYASRQRSLITGDDLGTLLAVLGDRRKLSVELTKIGAKLAPVRQKWERYRERFTPSQRAEAERLVSDISERLRRVIDSDEEDGRLLSARKQTVGETLRETHSTGRALSAYRTPSERPARLDHLDEG